MKICNKSLKIMKILWQKCVNDEKLLESPKKIGGNLDTRKPAFRRSGVLRRLDKITFYDQDPCAGDSGGPLMYQDPDSGRWVIIGWLEFHFIKNMELRNANAVQCHSSLSRYYDCQQWRVSIVWNVGFCGINVSVHYQLYVKWQLSKL